MNIQSRCLENENIFKAYCTTPIATRFRKNCDGSSPVVWAMCLFCFLQASKLNAYITMIEESNKPDWQGKGNGFQLFFHAFMLRNRVAGWMAPEEWFILCDRFVSHTFILFLNCFLHQHSGNGIYGHNVGHALLYHASDLRLLLPVPDPGAWIEASPFFQSSLGW